MADSGTFAISAAGMAVERLRVEVAALNLANANTVAGADGRLYQPLRVVPLPGGGAFGSLLGGIAVPSAVVEATQSPPRRILEPGHPLADPEGFVAQPSVDPVHEMMTMMSALRSYEANVAALNTARAMAVKALEIGGL